jgi:uncharacterized linocin/CFP29 family protein
VVNRNSAGSGLLNIQGIQTILVHPLNPGNPGVYGEKTFKAVTSGISELIKSTQPGPYALVLESAVYADTYAPIAGGTLTTTADRLIPLVPGGFYGTGSLPSSTGLLASLGGEPTSLYVGQDAITEHTQVDAEGNSRFRVFERVQVNARESTAFVKLEFT